MQYRTKQQTIDQPCAEKYGTRRNSSFKHTTKQFTYFIQHTLAF